MKKVGNISKFYHYAFPMQAVLVTVNDNGDKTNAITIAWHTPISKKPPLYGISVGPNRYSHNLIKTFKEFAINFAPYTIADKVNFCGTCSGKKVDKIKESGLTLIDSEKINTKLIKECFAHFECKLYDEITVGDHTLFIGEIVHILIDEKAFIDDLLNVKKVKPVYYIGDLEYITIDEKIDKF